MLLPPCLHLGIAQPPLTGNPFLYSRLPLPCRLCLCLCPSLLPQIWKGTQKASEHPLLDTPVAICSYISENAAPRLPALAVAAGGALCRGMGVGA